MTDIRDVAQQLSAQREEKVTRTPEYRAEIVEMRNSAGVDSVEVENQPFHVWVRLWSAQGSVVPAFNDKVASIAGLAVIVQSRPLPGRGKLEIVRVDDEILSAQDDAPNPGVLTVLHAEAHEWPDAGPGIDPVTVYPRAWSQLKVFAQNPLSLLVDVSPLRYYISSALVNFGGGTVDLAAAVGALAAGQARLVLVYLDISTNILGTTNGAVGADAGGWFLPEPAMTALTYPSAVVRIYGGQTEIDEDDIRDRRMFLAGAGTSIDGTGVANQVTYWTGASTIAGDAGFVYDPATGFVGVGIAVPTGHLHVYDITVDTDDAYYGMRNEHTKTAGATDHDDELAGIWNELEYDQAAGEIGHTQGIFNRYTLSDGNVGDVVNSRDIEGIQNQLLVYGGKVWGDVYGIRTYVDVAAPVTGDVYGHFIFVTDEEGVGGTVYMLYLDEETDVDYGIYQSGTADNYLGGWLGIGTPTPTVAAHLYDGAANSIVRVGFENDAAKWYIGVRGDMSDAFVFDENVGGWNTVLRMETDGTIVIPGGDLLFVDAGSGLIYGSCYGNHIAWQQIAAAQNTWYNISIAAINTGQLNGVTHNGTGMLTVTEPGRYLITYSLCYQDDKANDHLEVGISINGAAAEAAGRTHSENKFAGEEEHLGGCAILSLADNATIELAIRTTDPVPAPTIDVQGMNLSVVQIGG